MFYCIRLLFLWSGNRSEFFSVCAFTICLMTGNIDVFLHCRVWSQILALLLEALSSGPQYQFSHRKVSQKLGDMGGGWR